jgi:hypothetical protein
MQESGLAQKVERTLSELETIGVEPTLSRKIYVKIVKAGFNRATLASAFVLMQLAAQFQPINVRGLMYRAIGLLYPDSSDKSYNQTSHVVLKLRRAGIMPFSWIVDSTRRRLKPSTWTSLADFAQAVANAYRKDLWTNQKHHVEIFSEKDAMVGVVEPVTEALDVHCNIIRGQNSETSVYNTAEEWNQIKKPIYVYYIGDHDPDGFRIETRLASKVAWLDIATDLLNGNVLRSRHRILRIKACGGTRSKPQAKEDNRSQKRHGNLTSTNTATAASK